MFASSERSHIEAGAQRRNARLADRFVTGGPATHATAAGAAGVLALVAVAGHVWMRGRSEGPVEPATDASV